MTLRKFIEDGLKTGLSNLYLKDVIIQHTISNEGGVSLDGIAGISILEVIRPTNTDQPIAKVRFNTRLHDHTMNTVEWHDMVWCSQYEVLHIVQ